jgi:hypothetical protein
MSSLRRVLAAIGSVALVACGAFSAAGDASPAPAQEAGVDATAAGDAPAETPDALTAQDADASTDAPVDVGALPDGSLLFHGDFSNGCSDFGGTNATVTADPVARSGPSSCRVCATGSPATISQSAGETMPAGAHYVATAYVRTASPMAAADPMFIEVRVNSTGQAAKAVGPLLTDTFQAITTTLVVGAAGSTVGFSVGSTAGSGCFLVDDVSVVRVK